MPLLSMYVLRIMHFTPPEMGKDVPNGCILSDAVDLRMFP